jgi:uncharacterized damage-inducible protein DinB
MPSQLQRPAPTEYAPYYARYVDRVPHGEFKSLLLDNMAALTATTASVDEGRAGFRYDPGKWSIRQMLGHLIDAERIFVYRALRFARGDATPLPGFEQDDYVATAGSDARTLADLRNELLALRGATLKFFDSLPDEAWTRVGTASGHSVSVRALAYIILGHTMHHLHVLAERYGVPTITEPEEKFSTGS